MLNWDLVLDRVNNARGIGFDTCHKIYVLMDEKQMQQMREYDYDPLISADNMSADEMYRTVVDWYERSCGLRFIDAVATNDENDAVFETLIGQFDGDEEECEDCGEIGCYGDCYVDYDDEYTEEDEEDEEE